MDLKQLRTFLLVAETGSLSKASDRLRLAQPALSRQIKLLESEIGVLLFERSSRGMHLTNAGEEFFGRISGLVRQIDQSVIDIQSIASTISGQVSLGIMGTVSHFLSGPLVQRVVNDLPGVYLRIVEGSSLRLIEWLQRGEIDISLLYGPAADLHFRTKELFSEELFLIGPPNSFLRPDTPITFSELAKLDLVLTSRMRGIRGIVENAATKAKSSLKIRFESDPFFVLKDLVRRGLGYTILPKSAFSARELKTSFTIAPVSKPKLRRQVVLALPSDRSDTRAASALVEAIIKATTDLIESKTWDATLLARR